MKRRNRLLFALALIAGILLTALAALAEPGGSCGPNLTWSFLDGVMAVEGSGAMKDGAFWKEQVQPQEIEQVIVGDGVTRIGEEAFQGCENLKKVSLPDSLTAIGEKAFDGCRRLRTLRLPTEITEIGYESFNREDTRRLEIPVLHSTTGMTLGALDWPFYLPGDPNAYVFYHTETAEYIGLTLYKPTSRKLTQVEFPEGIDCIREGFFEGMSRLTSIRIPDSMTRLSLDSFAGIYRDCVILCGKGSAAEKFCLEKGLQFDNGERRVVGYDIASEKKKIRWIVQNYIRSGMTDRQKAQVLHNWLTTNCYYDSTVKVHDSKTLLTRGYGVCEAYAEAYSKLLTEAGVASMHLGAQVMDHAWNLVRVGGKWYHVDCTWDDPTVGPPGRHPCVSGLEKNQYFLLTDRQIKKDHKWEDRYLSADKGRPVYYYEPKTGRTIYLQIWDGTNSYLLDWDHHTATVLGPAFGPEKKITVPATFTYEKIRWKVTAIDDGAFRKNKKIQSVVIGKNVRKIGKNAFQGCTGLRTITLKNEKLTAEKVGSDAFGGLSDKVEVRCPEKQLKSYQKLLRKRGVSKKVKFVRIK